MGRRNQFTVDAESVQGNPGAEVTFKALLAGTVREYRETPMTDYELVKQHLVGWKGMVDDNDKPLPNPVDEPEILDRLYQHEVTELARLLYRGPDETSAKN